MSLDFSIEDFKKYYCDLLMSKEEMIRHFNITEYIYKKIIKDFGLLRSKTNKLNRFKANNGIKINNIVFAECEITKIDNNIEVIKDDENTENIINKVKSTLQISRKNRNIKK